MKTSILIRGARQLVTMHGPSGPRRGAAMSDIGVIEDGSVLIIDGTVASVGPSRRIANLAEARTAEHIDASGRVVIPGFVDCHTHLIGPPPKVQSRPENGRNTRTAAAAFTASAAYIRNTAAPTIEHQARRHLMSLLRHGTTTVEVKTGFGVAPGNEAKMLRAVNALGSDIATVVPTLSGAWTQPPDVADSESYIAGLCSEVLPRVRDRKSAHLVELFCDPEGFREPQARPYLEAVSRLGLPLMIHADVSERAGGASLAVEFGAASVSGLNSIADTEVQALARSHVVCTLLPGSMIGSGLRPPPARLLIDSGAAVALATGFDPSVRSTYNMQAAMALGCTELGLTPEEALVASTVNAAHALGMQSRCGAIVTGRPADIVLLNVSDYRDITLHLGVNIVAAVLRGGVVVYREGPLSCRGE